MIRHGLPYALSRWLSPEDPLFTPLVEEVTQETLLRVLDQLETFEGRSMFTTWVQKIAVRIALDGTAPETLAGLVPRRTGRQRGIRPPRRG